MCVTDRVSEQLAELHLTLGEGPGHDVLAAAATLLPADLGDGESGRGDPRSRRKPAAGAAAVFPFQLMIGAIQAGIIGLYRNSPGHPASRGLPPAGRHRHRAPARRPRR
jgi:hypothetical protein